jgi:mono/diheme cytochrome c family protein
VPDLKAAHVQNLSDGEMFYIIKNGVRFTGMPAWNLRDEQIWKMVLLTRQLSRPGTSPESRQNTSKQDSTQ